MTTNFDELVNAQRKFFSSKKTIPYAYRIEQLKKLAALIQTYESQFVETLYQDLHKSKFEAWGAEVGVVINELNYYINNLNNYRTLELSVFVGAATINWCTCGR